MYDTVNVDMPNTDIDLKKKLTCCLPFYKIKEMYMSTYRVSKSG